MVIAIHLEAEHMRNRLAVVILSLVAMVVLGSCSSISTGFGYGGNTCNANNDYRLNPSVEIPSSGLSGVFTSTIRFGNDYSRSGFAIHSTYELVLGTREQGSGTYYSSMECYSIGPGWEFVFSDKFRLLIGAGIPLSGSYFTREEIDEDNTITCKSRVGLANFIGFFDVRYFYDDNWFLSLRGSASRVRTEYSSYDCTINGLPDHYYRENRKSGFFYLATLGMGYNL